MGHLNHIPSCQRLGGHCRKEGRKAIRAKVYKETVSTCCSSQLQVSIANDCDKCTRPVQAQERQNSCVDGEESTNLRSYWHLMKLAEGWSVSFKSVDPGKSTMLHWKVTQLRIQWQHEWLDEWKRERERGKRRTKMRRRRRRKLGA